MLNIGPCGAVYLNGMLDQTSLSICQRC